MIAYEASLLRYVPDSLAGEFAIVALFIAERHPGGGYSQLRFEFASHTERLSWFFARYYRRADWTVWRNAMLDNFRRLERGYRRHGGAGEVLLPGAEGGQSFEGLLDAVSPHSSGSFRWSQPTVGADESLDAAFDYLFKRLVEQHDAEDEVEFVSDDELWAEQQPVVQDILRPAVARNVVTFDRAVGGDDPEVFRLVWRNGHLNAMDVLSLTVKTAKTIKNKQQRATGKLWGVTRRVPELSCSLLVSPPRGGALGEAFQKAKTELAGAPGVKRVIEPAQLPEFLGRVVAEAKPLS